MPKVSFYENAYKPNAKRVIDFDEALALVQGAPMRAQVEKLRAMAPAPYKKKKNLLPAITPGGIFLNPRGKENLHTPSGFIHFDFDCYNESEAHTLKNDLCKNQYTAWLFFSPSGKGVKGAFYSRSVANHENYLHRWLAMSDYFQATYGMFLDQACKDISRLCFLSFDEDIFLSKSPQEFNALKVPEIRPSTNGAHHRKGYPGSRLPQDVIIERCAGILVHATQGGYHHARLRAGMLLGGYIAAGMITQEKGLPFLLETSDEISSAYKDGPATIAKEHKAIMDGIRHGLKNPIERRKNGKS